MTLEQEYDDNFIGTSEYEIGVFNSICEGNMNGFIEKYDIQS
ncbi:hypothetical protein [Terrisporobacter othiniensis]|nr:hypothetical protein [Terrisporobacter othiniensis]